MALDALCLGTAVAPLLHHYRTSPEAGKLERKIAVELLLRPEPRGEEVWPRVPADGKAGFLRGMTRVSVEIQRALRCWIQLLWLGDLENLEDLERSARVAAYLALRPYHPKAKNAYAYDLLEDSHWRSIHRSVESELGFVLETIATHARLCGRHDLADYYAPRRAACLAKQVQKSPGVFGEVLVRENRLIKAWAPLVGKALDEDKLAQAREEVAPALRGIFRRDDDWRFLTPLLEIEATAGLEAHLKRPPSRRLEIRIRPQSGRDASPRNVIEFPRRGVLADPDQRAA